MSIMTQLEFELDFSSSEKTIAKYILDNGEDILNLSVKELAKQTYTSPATIVRLCRKLGLNGYGDFKIKYSAELQFDKKNKKRQYIYKKCIIIYKETQQTNEKTCAKIIKKINISNKNCK